MKKTVVLSVLFILPLVVYLFFASGVNRFGRLPVLSGPVATLQDFGTQEQLQGKITILGFLGTDIDNKKGVAFNLNQKIYKRFYEFTDFQMLMVVPKGSETQVEGLKKELAAFTDLKGWRFVYGDSGEIQHLFQSLGTNLDLDASGASPYVFIIDKDRNLRGRSQDEDEGLKFGFDATSVADLNNKMVDDVKIILAEYRLALKKNR